MGEVNNDAGGPNLVCASYCVCTDHDMYSLQQLILFLDSVH